MISTQETHRIVDKVNFTRKDFVERLNALQREGRVLRKLQVFDESWPNSEVAPPVGVDKQENRGTLLSDNQTDKED